MTSINAIRFDEYSGICVCDEARCWDKESLRIMTAYKMKPCIPEDIVTQYGTVAVYGNTGTSTLGDEFKHRIYEFIRDEYQKRVNLEGKVPSKFMTMEEIARGVFDILTTVKHSHLESQISGMYGFSIGDFLRGYYYKKNEKIEIKEKKVIDDVNKILLWENMYKKVTPVFLNAGILAGYDDEEGFRLYHYSLIEGYWEEVGAAFVVDGSGRDVSGINLADYFSSKVNSYSKAIDPIEGTIEIIKAVNGASRFNLGVSGYYNIIFISGREKSFEKRLIQINDHRSKLASDIVKAMEEGFISYDLTCSLISKLLFDSEDFNSIMKMFVDGSSNKREMFMFLRGYKKS